MTPNEHRNGSDVPADAARRRAMDLGRCRWTRPYPRQHSDDSMLDTDEGGVSADSGRRPRNHQRVPGANRARNEQQQLRRLFMLVARKTAGAVLAVLFLSVGALAVGTNSASNSDAIVIPRLINYQGKLTDGTGNPLTGNYDMFFEIWDAPSGGTSHWSETQNDVPVTAGLFNVILGSVSPITSLPDGSQCWLEVTVEGKLISPRVRLVSVPYAYKTDKAEDANQLGGVPAASYATQTWVTANDAGRSGVATDLFEGADRLSDKYAPISHEHTASDITSGVLAVARGGTGLGSYTANGILYASGTGTIGQIPAPSTNDTYLKYTTSGGYTWATVSGGVGGSGTGGMSARWTGSGPSTTLGNGAIQDNGVAIAVGASPAPQYAIYGVAPGSSAGYAGVYGYCSWSNSAQAHGVYGYSNATGGFGVCGYGANYYGVYGQSGTSFGVYGYTATYGSGWTTARGGVAGFNAYVPSSATNTYAFGVVGLSPNNVNNRCAGGVLGRLTMDVTWGALGYVSSGNSYYGGAGSTAWNTGAYDGFGCGWYGGLMGGWLKGNVYGATLSGPRYALYTTGNNYTSGYWAVMHNTGSHREAGYVPISTNVDVYASGVAELQNGLSSVTFPESFSKLVSRNVPVVVTVTALGPTPVYLTRSDADGFSAAAVDGKASVKFSWIAVGRRAGYEQNPVVPEELTRADFDSNIEQVMHNENDTTTKGLPMWFDGTRVHFEPKPR